jgi:hypothetical protein
VNKPGSRAKQLEPLVTCDLSNQSIRLLTPSFFFRWWTFIFNWYYVHCNDEVSASTNAAHNADVSNADAPSDADAPSKTDASSKADASNADAPSYALLSNACSQMLHLQAFQ